MSEIKYITVQGAREHNLKGVDVTLPRNKFIVFSICYEIAKNRINQLDTLIKNEKINGRLKNNRTNTANNVLKL